MFYFRFRFPLPFPFPFPFPLPLPLPFPVADPRRMQAMVDGEKRVTSACGLMSFPAGMVVWDTNIVILCVSPERDCSKRNPLKSHSHLFSEKSYYVGAKCWRGGQPWRFDPHQVYHE